MPTGTDHFCVLLIDLVHTLKGTGVLPRVVTRLTTDTGDFFFRDPAFIDMSEQDILRKVLNRHHTLVLRVKEGERDLVGVVRVLVLPLDKDHVTVAVGHSVVGLVDGVGDIVDSRGRESDNTAHLFVLEMETVQSLGMDVELRCRVTLFHISRDVEQQ